MIFGSTGANEKTQQEKIKEFISELNSFAATAEKTLEKIELNLEDHKNLFSIFSERMVAIRGTSLQLGLGHIAKIAGLGEEIAVKGAAAEIRPQIRKCVGALWDALTTVKYLLEHHQEETGEEQQILIQRLEDTLRVLGGGRLRVDSAEIESLMRSLQS